MRDWNHESFRTGRRRIDVVVASIAQLDERMDALVSSDDSSLSHGGGVSAAIWSAAGPELSRFVARAKPPLRLGDVFVSPAGKLNARVLLHAITADLDENRIIPAGQLGSLYLRTLATAEECQCQSIALPLLGTGALGLDLGSTMRAVEDALNAWLASPSALT